MRDFTIRAFCDLLHAIRAAGYDFQTLEDFLTNPSERVVILRHDIDRAPANALQTAIIENNLGIRGSYYFRYTPSVFVPDIISKISSLSHEIGYHYEDLSRISKVTPAGMNGFSGSREEYLVRLAFASFGINLQTIRKIAPVRTICMHGSPTNRWDSRLLWKYHDFADCDIIGEPYFSLNFEKMLYLTDTGRKWNGGSVSIRDKVVGKDKNDNGKHLFAGWKTCPSPGSAMQGTMETTSFQERFIFRHTGEIINALRDRQLPDQIMITIHPQRWNDALLPWAIELLGQRSKNKVKYLIIKGGFLRARQV